MKIDKSLSRWLRRISILLLCGLMLPAAYAYNLPGNDDDDDDDECDEEAPECCPDTGVSSFGFVPPFGRVPFEPELGAGSFRIRKTDPSPLIFTPQIVYFGSRLGSQLSFANPESFPTKENWTLGIVANDGKKAEYRVLEGESIGLPLGQKIGSNRRIQLLDEAGEPTVAGIDEPLPTYVREFFGDGTSLLYDWQTHDPISFQTKSGRNIVLADLPEAVRVEVLREENILRQVKAAQGLADFVQVDDDAFEIRLYTYDNLGTKDTEGFYQPTGQPYRVIRFENDGTGPNNYSRIKITKTWGPRVTVDFFEYNDATESWDLAKGSSTGALSREEKTKIVGPGSNQRTYIRTLYDAQGIEVSRTVEVFQDFPWGGDAMIRKEQDPEGLNLVTTRQYYTSSSQPGYGKLRQQTFPDGFWKYYTYGTDRRTLAEAVPWKDAPASGAATGPRVETQYAYTSHDADDTVTGEDFRPRTVSTVIFENGGSSGIVTARTFHVYAHRADGRYEQITERAASQSAAYGESGNLRTTRVYYPTDPEAAGYDAVSAGRLEYVDYPDGTRRSYSYTQDTGSPAAYYTETESLVTPAQPDGVSGKSTRTVRVYNFQGNLVSETSYVHTGSWTAVNTTTHSYDAERFRTGSARDGRTTYAATYSGGLLVARTNQDGIEILYTHDDLGRVETATKVGAPSTGSFPAQEDILTFYDRTLGEIDCGCDGELVTTITGGSLSLSTTRRKDRAGRVSEFINEAGLITTWSYDNGGRTVTILRPDTATEITEHYLDRRRKSRTGTGIVAEYYDYGVNSDGSTWTETRIASAESPRFHRTTRNMLGQVISEETPASTGGTFTVSYEYNDRGLLSKQTQPSQADTLFSYDSLGRLVQSGLDSSATGSLNLASSDRITDTARSFQNLGGVIYEVSTTTVYATTNDATPTTHSESRRRLSGFSGNLASETITVDIHGNETTRTVERDFANKTVTVTTTTPASSIDAVSVSYNGLLQQQNSSTVAAPVTYGYDDLGRRVSVQEPRHEEPATTTYSATTGQVIAMTDAAGNSTAYTYHPGGHPGAGQVASVEDALGQFSYFAYSLRGEQVRRWGETDYPIELSHNSFGELVTLTTWRDPSETYDFATATWPDPSGGDITTWIYQESTGLLARKQYADNEGTDYSYDSANRLSTRIWARGVVTTYGYDSATSELTGVTYSDSTPALVFTYDRLGRQDTVTDATGTRSFAYNNVLQLDSETLDSTFYDGRILSRLYQDGTETNGLPGRNAGYQLGTLSTPDEDLIVHYAYDSAGRMFSVADAQDTFTYARVADSDLLASITGPVHSVEYLYEANRDVKTQVKNTKTPGTPAIVSLYVYTYDALGRREDRQQSGTAFSTASIDNFSYNPRSEVVGSTNDITSAFTFGYAYDNIGNRLHATEDSQTTEYVSNELNQYTQLGVSAPWREPLYDLDGNMTFDGEIWTLTWNGENRLISATDGTTTLSFSYDYMGRLVQRDDGTTETFYVYDDWNRIATFTLQSSTFTLHSTNLWGLDLTLTLQGAGGVGGLLREGNHYTLYDVNGNITQKLDDTGDTIMAVDYDPFGKIISVSGSLEGEYRFSTKPQDDELGWYYYGYRFYDSTLGRWLNRDPIQEQGGINLNLFVVNNPIDLVDKLGLNINEDAARHVIGETLKGNKYGSTGQLGRVPGGDDLVDDFLDITINFGEPDEPEGPATCGYSGSAQRAGCKTRCYYQCSWGQAQIDVDASFDSSPCEGSISDPRG